MKSLHQTLLEYKSQGKALPAFNIDSFEIYQAVEETIKETFLPCIVQLSAGEDQFVQAERLFFLVRKAQVEGLPIYLNMDHGKDLVRLEKLINLGFDMVHFDGSNLDYETNLEITKNFIQHIKSKHPEILIEVEFNKINLANESVLPDSFTHPNQAYEFMTQTHADLLAVSVGNLHGVNLQIPEKIDIALLQKIFDTLPAGNFVTLHGGSGIDPKDINQAVKSGIVKININTDLRLKFKESLNKSFTSSNSDKIYEYLNPVIDDLKMVIKQKLILFSSNSYV